ncbi:MAG: chitobiase/beta-hexosaminidase C-terminal domain-containing protein, partial [Casimicrobium sp.]
AKSGVRIMGNGRSGSNKTVVIAPTAWDFTADNTVDKPEGYSVLVSNVQNVTIDQIEFRGIANKANGAIRVVSSSDVLLRDLAIYDYRYTGLNIIGEDNSPSMRIDAQNIYLENSGYEWLPGVSTQFPAGGSVGNLGISNVDDSVFAFISIKTTSRRGYGVKVGNWKRSRFLYSQFEMFPEQSWNGGGPGNFDMELFGSHEKVELAHNKFRQTVSLISFPNGNYESIPYSVHVHHNDFRLAPYAYGLETEGSKFVVDHNWFANTWTAMQRFGDPPDAATALSRNVTVFNNVVDGLDSRLVGLKGRVENLRIFNNTVYLGPGGIAQNYLVTVGSSNRSARWMVGNNVIVGSANKPSNSRYFVTAYQTDEAPRDVLFSNNVYKDIAAGVSIDSASQTIADPVTWDHRYVSNVNADPALPQSGANAYEPIATSSVVDVGNNDIGVRRAFVGGARDVGAFERGQAAWRYGLGSASEIEYLWAPTTSIRDEFFIGSVNVGLNSQPGTQIRYTLDGTEPGWNSTLYTAPINVTSAVKLRARAFNEHFASGPALMLNLAPNVRGYPNLALGLPESAYTASSSYFEHDP